MQYNKGHVNNMIRLCLEKQLLELQQQTARGTAEDLVESFRAKIWPNHDILF